MRNWRKILILAIVLGVVLTGGGIFKTLVLNKPSLTPQEVTTEFFKAIQEKNKERARSFLSPNANREAFKSTLEEAPEIPSLYQVDFQFSITDVRLVEENTKAEASIEITVDKALIKNKTELVKEGSWLRGYRWLISDSYGVTESPELIEKFEERVFKYEEGPFKRAVIYLAGPAHLYLTSPQGKHVGTGPAMGEEINEIEGAFYSSQTIHGYEHVAIQDLVGIWNLKVIGTGSGNYVLTSEIVDRDNHQIKKVEGEIKSGEIIEYEISYPEVTGIPIEFLPVSE